MTTTPHSSTADPITMLTLLREIRRHCESERMQSLETVHRQFIEAVCHCSRPTAPSNPSMSFFADWLARNCGLTGSSAGKWQMLSLDFWQIMHELESDDTLAFFKFWELFDEFCRLDERIVSSLRCTDANTAPNDGALLRCELVQLFPETGVYLRCYRAESEAILGERITNYGFFDSIEIAKQFAATSQELVASGWET